MNASDVVESFEVIDEISFLSLPWIYNSLNMYAFQVNVHHHPANVNMREM